MEAIIISSVLGTIFWIITAYVLSSFSLDLQQRKGYNDGSLLIAFIVTFFFGLVHLIYSAGLPLAKDDCTLTKEEKKQLKELSKNETDYVYCKKCGCVIKDITKGCSNCNNTKTTDKPNKYNENASFIYCKKCGFPIYDDEEKCANCGYPKDGFNKK